MLAFKPLFLAVALGLPAMLSLADASVLPPAHDNGLMVKRDPLSECQVCDKCDDQQSKAKQVQLKKSSWSQDIFSSFKADSINLDVTFTFSNGGGVRSQDYMLIANKGEDDYTVFVHAEKVFFNGYNDKETTTAKAFTIKGKHSCTADLLAGASVSSIYQVDAIKE